MQSTEYEVVQKESNGLCEAPIHWSRSHKVPEGIPQGDPIVAIRLLGWISEFELLRPPAAGSQRQECDFWGSLSMCFALDVCIDNGQFYCRITAGEFTKIMKMLLLK